MSLYESVNIYSKRLASVNLLLQIILCSYWGTCGSVKNEKASSLYSRYNLHMRWTVKVSRKKENLVAEYCYRIPFAFDLLFYWSEVDLEKVDWQWTYDREGIFVRLFVEIMTYILRVLTYKSVKHTVIKACNNKIEQDENNVLFYVCVCSYLGRRKSSLLLWIPNAQPALRESW